MLRLAAVIASGVMAVCTARADALPGDLAMLEARADEGDAPAQSELALRYQNAEGVPRDIDKANGLLCKAARQGYAEAQYQLAWSYAYGRGEPRDDATAAAFFRMAADQGHAYAARALELVHVQPAAKLPACMDPDPPPVAAADTPAAGEGSPDEAGGAAFGRVPADIEKLVRRLAPEYAVDTRLVLALIATESGFNPSAVSPRNAQGLMQLIPETAARFGVKKILNPVDNLRGGLAYLRWLLAFFRGDVPLVLAAYNAGEGAVEKYRGVPPYAETRNYVEKITRVYRKPTHPYEPGVVEPSGLVTGRTTVRRGWDTRPIVRR